MSEALHIEGSFAGSRSNPEDHFQLSLIAQDIVLANSTTVLLHICYPAGEVLCGPRMDSRFRGNDVIAVTEVLHAFWRLGDALSDWIQSRKVITILGSNCRPEQRRSSATASSKVRALS